MVKVKILRVRPSGRVKGTRKQTKEKDRKTQRVILSDYY